MTSDFDYFVVFAEMRTGSNFLEENINSFDDLKCWGEAFNPKFIGGAGNDEMLGVTMHEREGDPIKLILEMQRQTPGVAGFRFFHDHDPRVLEHVLADKRCKKIVLTRNPLDSYVSRKIARETNQWRLGDHKNAKTAQVEFDLTEFEGFLADIKGFQVYLMRELQKRGQSAYYINYEDIQDVEVINGMAAFLGSKLSLDATSRKTKVQNPAALKDKVTNFDEMQEALKSIDHFNLSNTPNFEPRRGPVVPTYIASELPPLLYMPVRGGPEISVGNWLRKIQVKKTNGIQRDFNQKTLTEWKKAHPGYQSFTVLAHPVARLHRCFCRYIVNVTDETYTGIRDMLRRNYKLPLPEGAPDASYTREDHADAFGKFAGFIAGNLNGQTSTRVDATWASQLGIVSGFADVTPPHRVILETDMEAELNAMAARFGKAAEAVEPQPKDTPYALDDIYSDDIEQKVRRAYKRDYIQFGFTAWRQGR